MTEDTSTFQERIEKAYEGASFKETIHPEPLQEQQEADRLQAEFNDKFHAACNELDDVKRKKLTEEAYDLLQEWNKKMRVIMGKSSSTRQAILMALQGGK